MLHGFLSISSRKVHCSSDPAWDQVVSFQFDFHFIKLGILFFFISIHFTLKKNTFFKYQQYLDKHKVSTNTLQILWSIHKKSPCSHKVESPPCFLGKAVQKYLHFHCFHKNYTGLTLFSNPSLMYFTFSSTKSSSARLQYPKKDCG